jgi:hypothetical protein
MKRGLILHYQLKEVITTLTHDRGSDFVFQTRRLPFMSYRKICSKGTTNYDYQEWRLLGCYAVWIL